MTIQVTVKDFDELREFARMLLSQTESAAAPAEIKQETTAKVEPDPEPIPKPVEEEKSAPEKEEKIYTITEVRGFLGNMRKNGKKEAVTKLIEDMGYSKFSLVPEDKYPELMRRAEEL